ncbi:HTTM domain-containing protein [Halorutilales archaeon Cl-col2-1]
MKVDFDFGFDWKTVRSGVERRLSVDVRSLAALRLSLGLLVVADLVLRSRDLVAHYTDSGVFPRSALRDFSPVFSQLPLHAVSGETWFVAALFVVAGVAAILLAIGHATRLAALVTVVLLVSLQMRNPVVLNGGDSVLRRLLIWSLFLPLGGVWSVDSSRREREVPTRIATPATAAVLIQVVVIYSVNAVFKLRNDVWMGGDAGRYVFSIDRLTVGVGEVLAQHPDIGLLGVTDYFWLGLVVSSPLLLVLKGRRRGLLVSVFVLAHLGMLGSLNLGLFPLISIAGLIPFVPTSFWNHVSERIGTDVSVASETGHGVVKSRLRPASAVVVVLIGFLVFWNAASLGYVDVSEDSPVDPEKRAWDMFAKPPESDGWYVVRGSVSGSASGSESLEPETVNAFPVSESFEKPPDVDSTYPSHRWMVYLVDLQRREYADLRPYFGGYVCERWDGRATETRLRNVTVYYVEQPTRFGEPEPILRRKLGEYSCND